MGPEAVLGQYEAKINLHDFDLLVPLISPDAVFWFNDGSHVGLPDIRAAFERTWASFPLESYDIEQLNWLAATDDAAACTYHFHWTAMLDGNPVSGGGRGTTILRREGGAWKIIHEHLSRFP